MTPDTALFIILITGVIFAAVRMYRIKERDYRKLYESHQKQNEELFRAREKEHLKNRYMGIVIHDLRNPIHAVQSLSDLIRNDGPNLNEDQRELLGYISESAEQMNRLVSDLLDIQKIEEGVWKTHMEELRVHTILDGLIAGYRVQAAGKKIEIGLRDTIRDQVFRIDKSIFLQVADNLISNAIKFSPGGTRVEVLLDTLSGELRLRVKDQGPGIKKEEMPFMFERFRKLSNRPTGNEISTGLGLSIIKDRLEAVNGSITCESTVGKGTLFTVLFPQNEQADSHALS